MREQLIQYVNLLFAGTAGCEEIRQEILQNTLDRYDDLIKEGKVPQAAYRLAITGIGDINEILGTAQTAAAVNHCVATPHSQKDAEKKKQLRAVAIGIYIIAAIPLILLESFGLDILGLCLTLLLVAGATVLLIVNSTSDPEEQEKKEDKKPVTHQQELKDSIGKLIGTIGLVVYFYLSFKTQAWYITWLVFPIMAAAKGLTNAIVDLLEAMKHEN